MSERKRVAEVEHASRVREMFANIAARYDLLNHLLSGNIDKRWRRIAASRVGDVVTVGSPGILDVACGTGDLSLTLFETTGAQIVGTDFCHPMLELAKRKTAHLSERIKLVEADALCLPFSDELFDAVTIAFGLRNLSSVELGLTELRRVLKPGGWLAVLEFSRPASQGLRTIFGFYFTRLLPMLGSMLSGSKGAYRYLPDSVGRFPDQKSLATLMGRVGFERVEYQNLTGGIAALHLARRPGLDVELGCDENSQP